MAEVEPDQCAMCERGPLMARVLKHPVLFILAAFLALGVTYIHLTPPFETPDEYGHYAYVRFLAEERQLPPLVVSSHEWEQGQFHQPPLYYIVGALLAGPRDTDAWQTAYPRNRFAALGQPNSPGNKNAVVHPASATVETQRTDYALRLLRALSLACSAITIWLTYCLALTIAPRQRWLALGAAAILAFNPQFLFISASANNDVMVTVLAAAVLLLCTRVARQGAQPYRTPIILGVLGGLAALAKLSGQASLGLVPCAYLIHYGRGGRRRLWPDLLRPLLLCAASAVLVGGWWYLRNACSYNDPLGMLNYAAIFSVHDQPLPLVQAAAIMYEALPSYWGVFGWMNVLAPKPYYVAMRSLTVLACIGLLLRGIKAWHRQLWPSPASRRAGLVAGVWALVMLALILRWTQTITRTQGRLLFPAAGVFGFLMVLGLTGWLPRGWRPTATRAMIILLLAAAAAMPWAVIAPSYTVPARMQASELPEDLSWLEIRYGDQITLIGARVLSEEAIPGESVWVRLYWRAESSLDQSYIEGVQLVGPGGERLGGRDTLPAMGLYPTTHWSPGEVIIDDCAVPVNIDASGPVAAAIRVSLYAERYEEALPVTDARGTALGPSAEIARVRLARHGPWDGGTPTRVLSVNLDDLVGLYGYDLDASQADEDVIALDLALYWESLKPVSESYTVLVHLLDRTGSIVGQADSPPLGGSFATEYWQVGDQMRDTYRLAVSRDLMGESLRLRVGLYLPTTNERLAVKDSDPRTDYVTIGPFRLTAEGVVFDQVSS